MLNHNTQPMRMIFHHPLPLPVERTSGSRVRPLQLLAAFQELGYAVTVVAGNGADRYAAIKTIHDMVTKGERFAFLYAEPPNAPLLWLNRQQPHRFQEYSFWRWCRAHGIPVGLFYRDVHWRFAQFKVVTAWHKRAVLRPLYWMDWLSYYGCVDHLFLPSLGMAAHLPTRWPASRLSALPPGCTLVPATPTQPADEALLNLFYVGGIQPPLYDLKPMFMAVEALNRVHLRVCCRAEEWAAVRLHYAPFDETKIAIVHAQGDALDHYYRAADLFGLFWQPSAYLDFAMPVKLFESMSYSLPLVTTAGTETARFVASEGVGWVVASTDDLCALLVRLRDNRTLVAAQRRQVEAVCHHHTWLARAQTIAERLMAYQRAPTSARVVEEGERRSWATKD